MQVVVLATCITCDGALALKQAAIGEGYEVTMESVERSDERTERSARVGIGLPVLVREDGALSDDAVNWKGVKGKKRTHVTHPVSDVIDDASPDNA